MQVDTDFDDPVRRDAKKYNFVNPHGFAQDQLKGF
jgi:hypothetical protein